MTRKEYTLDEFEQELKNFVTGCGVKITNTNTEEVNQLFRNEAIVLRRIWRNGRATMTRKEEREQASFEYHSKPYLGAIKDDFVNGAEWADRTMLDKVYDFIIANAYKYGKVKFVDNGTTFDFRMNTFLNDLKRAMEK